MIDFQVNKIRLFLLKVMNNQEKKKLKIKEDFKNYNT